jgi:hypothetical protein
VLIKTFGLIEQTVSHVSTLDLNYCVLRCFSRYIMHVYENVDNTVMNVISFPFEKIFEIGKPIQFAS